MTRVTNKATSVKATVPSCWKVYHWLSRVLTLISYLPIICIGTRPVVTFEPGSRVNTLKQQDPDLKKQKITEKKQNISVSKSRVMLSE